MEKDSHYYVMYYLCLAAGMPPEKAYEISYSSQYVDDSTDGHTKRLYDRDSREIGTFEPIRTSHNGFESIGADVQEKIYYPFHFLPGFRGESLDEKMVTRPGAEGVLFNDVLGEALKGREACRIGIALHVLADTYSHCDFSGLWAWENDVRGVNYIPSTRRWFFNLASKIGWMLFARNVFEIAPAIGHSQAYTFPDLPFMNWKYSDWKGRPHSVSNSFKFRQAFEDLYGLLITECAVLAGGKRLKEQAMPFERILQVLWNGVRTSGRLEKRCGYWRKAIIDLAGERGLTIPRTHLEYDKSRWERDVVKRMRKWFLLSTPKMKLKVTVGEFEKSPYYRFHAAALEHRKFVVGMINSCLMKKPKKKAGRAESARGAMGIRQDIIDGIEAKRTLVYKK